MKTLGQIPYLTLWVIFLLLGNTIAFSQSTTVQFLRTSQVYAGKDHEAGANDYRWKIWLDGTLFDCIHGSGEPGWYNKVRTLTTNKYVSDVTSQSFELRGEAWEEDGCGGECSFNTGLDCRNDDGHCGPNNNYFSIYDFEPGKTNEIVLWPCTTGNPYAVRYEFAYDVPQPETPDVSAPSGLICETNPTIELSSNSFIKSTFRSKARFVWEYRVGSSPTWQFLGSTSVNSNNGRFSFNYLRFLLGNITTNTNVYFRVQTRYTTSGSTFESPYSGVSNAVRLSPLPPSITSVSSTPSCPGQSTGKITVNVNGNGQYLYVLRPGRNSSPCNPGSGDCGGSHSGRVYTNEFTLSNVAAGSHTLIVGNRGGSGGVCWNYIYVNVEEVPELELQSPSITPVSCHGGSDGEITMNSTGGQQPWSYNLLKSGVVTTNSSGSFTKLSAGNYTSYVVDGCWQLASAPVIITEPLNILADVTYHSPTCNSPANGSVQIEVTQGEGAYAYKLLKNSSLVQELDSTQTDNWTVNNLDSGNYIVEIRDAARLQCQAFTTSSKMAPAPAFPINTNDIVKQDITCFGNVDGAILLNDVDTSGAYAYILMENGTSQFTASTNPSFHGLGAAYYTMIVQRNIPGCSDYFIYPSSISITEPEEVIVTLDKKDISCFGRDDGSILASVQGPTSSDQYTWETLIDENWATLSNTTTTLPDLAQGTYRMRVTNNNGCSAQSSEATITEPPLFSIDEVIVRDIKCYGEQGEIEAILSGGTMPYQYQFTASDTDTDSDIERDTYDLTVESDTAITEFPEGIYTLRAIDANGCTVDYVDSLTISAPDSALTSHILLSDFNGYNTTCTGANDAFIEITAQGGNGGPYAGYQYTLDSNVQTSPRFENIPPGPHTLSVYDGRGCMVTKNLTITEPASDLVVTLSDKKDVVCFGYDDGQLSVDAVGGVAPYTFTISDTATQNNGTFSNLSPDSYTITIRDMNGCATTYTDEVLLLTPTLFSVDKVTVHDIKCHGEPGEVETILSGGTLPYQYQYITSDSNIIESTKTITTLTEGVYALHALDANGCVADHPDPVTITTPTSALTSSYSLSDFNGYNTSCAGANDAFAEITAQGGNGGPYAGYLYALDSNFQTGPRFESIAPGPHTLSVYDGRGCVVTKDITITEPASELMVTLSDKKDVLCFGNNDGLLSVDVVGGVAPYTFTIADIAIQNNGTFSSLSPDSYSITIRDVNGCATTYVDEVLLLTTPINVTSSITNVHCNGENEGAVDISATGGDGPLVYLWDKNQGTSPDIQNLEAGEYVLTVTDQQGCSTLHMTTVSEPEKLSASVSSVPICTGKSEGELHVQAEGGSSPFKYSIDNGFSFQDNALFTDIAKGSYEVIVKDIYNCTATATATITERIDLPQPNFLVATKQNALDTLVVKEISIPKPDSLEWIFDEGITVINEDTWSPEITVEQQGTYSISLKGYFDGCDYSKTLILDISPFDSGSYHGANIPIEVINAVVVNPNPNDGAFDVQVELNTSQSVSIQVFDMSGVIHFRKNWDKTSRIEEPIDITGSATSSGIYIVQIITETDAREKRIIINR